MTTVLTMKCPICGAKCVKKRWCKENDIPYEIVYKSGEESLQKCGNCKEETTRSLWQYILTNNK